MFEQLRHNIGLSYTRFRFRGKSEEALRWTGALSGARRALLLMPESPQDSAELAKVMEYCSERFAPKNLVLVGHVDRATQLRLDRGVEIIAVAPTDINTWFLPRSVLTRKVKKSTFDVAIDLNLDVALPSAYLCRASGARIRVGFKKRFADTFYNFQVQPHHATNFGAACNGLIECLQMF
ncbi:MAG: hypothetical protein ACRDGA_11745 [Bacteroidota bacterium]